MHRIAALLFSLGLGFSAIAATHGEASFQNDTALNWARDCVERGNAEFLAEALQSAINSEFIERPDGETAVAAAEVIAAAGGQASTELPAELGTWLQQQPGESIAALLPQAREAIERVKDRKVSELSQNWSEQKGSLWSRRVAELETRLARARKPAR